MTRLEETAYPRLKSHPTPQDLVAAYTPTWDESVLANTATRGMAARLCFLILLKTYQRLGYPPLLTEVPRAIVEHIARSVGATMPVSMAGYDTAGTRQRHLLAIRAYVQVSPWGPGARRVMLGALHEAARTKNEVSDLINVALDELVHQRYELPAFDTLERAARHVRAAVTRALYQQVEAALSPQAHVSIDALFIADLTTRRTPWNDLKADPGRPTLTHLKELLARQQELAARNVGARALATVPPVKIQHLAAEAMTLDAARMGALAPRKRYTLAATLLYVRAQQTLDDLGTMFTRQMRRLHNAGKAALAAYRTEAAPRTDALVGTLRDLVVAHGQNGTPQERFAAMDAVIGARGDALIEECDLHLAYAGSNYYPFLWRPYRSHRATLFHLLNSLTLRTTTQDGGLEDAVRFLRAHAGCTAETLRTGRVERTASGDRLVPLLDLSWIPEGWWRLVTGERTRHTFPERINRRQFEVCVFSQVLWDLCSGDLCIVGSNAFADYRDQLVSWAEYETGVAEYGRVVGLPVAGADFVAHVRGELEETARATDRSFPSNKTVRLDKGEPVILRPPLAPVAPGLPELEAVLATRMEVHTVSVLEALADTTYWLNWTRFFGPISGFDARIDDPIIKYLAVVFCYGSSLGPAELARSFAGLDRRQIIWINQRHISEDHLDRAIACVVDGYRRFTLPKCWGSATRIGADGTQWELYENNLLAERHIRYGGYGGIGYYHVAGDYIALFSRFIPCGTLEGAYILDPFFMSTDDEPPEAVHSDTHGQSATIFGLSYLLGIQLMPRIRQWKDLTWCRPTPETHYDHLEGLFTETIDWAVITTHLPDMLRVALSIKEGRFTPSTILRRLGTYSRKNKLYHAFRELGRAVRTGFLLRYLSDEDLRSTIQAALNKNEAFNNYIQWVAFGGEGLRTENDRAAQRKLIKYTHLMANCLLFSTVALMSRELSRLREEGYPIEADAVAALSPYMTPHLNRFGRYSLDPTRVPLPLEYDAPILSASPVQGVPGTGAT